MGIWDGEPTFWEDKEHIEKVGIFPDNQLLPQVRIPM